MFFKLWNFEQRRGGNPGVKNSRQIKYMEQAEDFTYYTIYLAFHQHQHLHTFSHAKDEKLQKKIFGIEKIMYFKKYMTSYTKKVYFVRDQMIKNLLKFLSYLKYSRSLL